MENIRDTAELVFKTSLGGTRTIRVPNPTENLSQVVVDTTVSRLLLANPFDETVGDLEKLMRADRVVVSRRVLLPAAA